MSGHGENVEALSCVCDCGEINTMSHLMTCGDIRGCPKPCQSETTGRSVLTVAILRRKRTANC